MASVDTSTIVGITTVISFVVFFSLGLLLATCIGCMVKTRSKATPIKQQSIVYDMIGTSQERIGTSQEWIATIKVEDNSAYESARNHSPAEYVDYI